MDIKPIGVVMVTRPWELIAKNPKFKMPLSIGNFHFNL